MSQLKKPLDGERKEELDEDGLPGQEKWQNESKSDSPAGAPGTANYPTSES